MSKNIGKNTSMNLSGKCSQEFLDHAKQAAWDALETTSKINLKNSKCNWWFDLQNDCW